MNYEQENGVKVARISFLENQKKSEEFLKQGVDLHFGRAGERLDDLVCLDPSQLHGIIFHSSTLLPLAVTIYQYLGRIKHEKLRIKNSNVTLFLYTMCESENYRLFLVWQIMTNLSTQGKASWEEQYGILPGQCCQKNSCSMEIVKTKSTSMDYGLNFSVSQDQEIKSLPQENCKYKKQHVDCVAAVSSHLYTLGARDGTEGFPDSQFSIPVAKKFKLSKSLQPVLFCYGGVENPRQVSCTSLYDSLVFENCIEKNRENVREHNFKNFLLDSLSTCYYYQKTINTLNRPSKKLEQRLLYASIYI